MKNNYVINVYATEELLKWFFPEEKISFIESNYEAENEISPNNIFFVSLIWLDF